MSPLVPSGGAVEDSPGDPQSPGRDSGSEQGHLVPQTFSLRGDLYRDRLGGGIWMCCGCSHFPGERRGGAVLQRLGARGWLGRGPG